MGETSLLRAVANEVGKKRRGRAALLAHIQREMEADMVRRRDSGDEAGADALADFLDRLHGWCAPHMRLDDA